MKPMTDLQVFVAYSWDSEPHKEKVKIFVQNLRLNGINVIYDEELSYGKRIQHFMENSISQSDIVLFICTPNYKRRADSRTSGVGYESEIITSEIYETSNEEKFIPVLFTGNWAISLPTWAKGKKGVDLSTPELYQTNLPKLLSYLQSVRLNPHQKVSAPQYSEAELTTTGIHLDMPFSNGKRVKVRGKKRFGRFFDPTTFRGLVLVAVISGIILLFISPILSSFLPNPNNFTPNGSLIDDTNSNSVGSNNFSPDHIPPDTDPPNTSLPKASGSDDMLKYPDDIAHPDNTLQDTTIQKDNDSYDNFEYLISIIGDSAPNGTMPKGTNPVTIDVPEETKEQLAFIPKLAIGCSKNWIDNTLGPPFAEKTMSIKEDGLLWPFDDENSKIGEVLACAYRISDIAMVQVCFDIPDHSCQAYFVTLLADVPNVDITMPKAYSALVSNKPLGEFSFSEIERGLESAYGFSGTDNARTLYSEEYYFAGTGNYYDFYFAVLDHGMLNSLEDFVWFLSNIQFYIGPMDDTLPLPDIINRQREKFYPNTYGISNLDTAVTIDFLCNYFWYDTLMFRDVT